MRDISFGDSCGFTKTYHLSGWNEAAVFTMFTQELHISLEKLPRWSAWGSSAWIVLYRERRVSEPAEPDALVDRALELFGLFQFGE